MNTKRTLTVVTIGFAKQALIPGSREHTRMRRYARALHEYHIIVFTKRGESGASEVVREEHLSVYPTNSVCKLFMLIDAFRMGRRVLKMCTGDVVLSAQDPFLVGLCVYVLGKATGVRTHLQVHGDYFDSRWAGTSLTRILEQHLALFLFKRVPQIRVVSKRIYTSLIGRGIPGEKITVLPIRPELETFLRVPRPAHDHAAFTFLAASRFSPEKNIPLMLRAFARVQRHHANAHLRIVGKGPLEKHIRTLTSTLDVTRYVTIIPWTEKIEEEMARADVFLSTSDHEAYGLTIVEAMAVGVPVITTDVGCVGDIFQDGVHGIVVPTRDEDALVRAMERMMLDRTFRESCGGHGRTRARELASLTEDAYVEAWVSAFLSGVRAV